MQCYEPRFWLPRTIFKSKAIKGLSGTAILVLIKFYMLAHWKPVKGNHKRNSYQDQINTDELRMTYKNVEDDPSLQVTKKTFTKSIDDLISRGFIKITHSGGGYQGDATMYGLSEMWKKYGNSDFKITERKKYNTVRGFIKPKQ